MPAGRVGIVIGVELLDAVGDVVWIDDVSVTTPAHATVLLPGGAATPARRATWGRIKSIYP